MRPFTQKEETVMQVLWKLKKAFVKEILDELPEPKPPVTTLSSLIRKLEEEGFIGHDAFGRTHRYFPILKKSEYRNSTFKNLLDNYFSGSPEQVLSFFVQEEQIPVEELDELLEKLKKN